MKNSRLKSLKTPTLIAVGIMAVSVVVAWLLSHAFDNGAISGWAQAVGAVLAIVFGFASSDSQVEREVKKKEEERKALVDAACLILHEALEIVSERLDTALTSSGNKVLSLQGNRTTEMVLAVREFDTDRLPPTLLADFIKLRSCFFAINERVSDVFISEEAKKHRPDERWTRLESAVRVRKETKAIFAGLLQHSREFGPASRSFVLKARPQLDQYERDVKP